MTEQEARQVLLLQAHEGEGGKHWSSEDRLWATRQAAAVAGDEASPERFVVARAMVAMQRLLPRDASARRWLERRAWHLAWVWLGAVLGFIAGVAADRLGPPEHVNLLAPAVWAVVLWNLCVYAAALMPWHGGVGSQLGPWFARRGQGTDVGASLLWARHAAPLSMKRAALVLHVTAAALALGLVAGLYLRGLVLDYRAGWQSTFLDVSAVQALLNTLLAPASLLTGIGVPDVAPLRVGAGAPAQATAAPWIHLYAGTLMLWVVVPRLLLAWWSAWRADALSRRFPLPLDTPYFEALHPLMRPGLSRVVRLMWVTPPGFAPVTLLGHVVPADLEAPLTLLKSDEGDELQLLPAQQAPAAPAARWWNRWRAPQEPAPPQADAVLLVNTPGVPQLDRVSALQRPVLVLRDADVAEPPALPLRRLADGWLPEGGLWQALLQLFDGDPRLVRLAAAWTSRQRALLDAGVDEIAQTLARVAGARQAVTGPGAGLLSSNRAEAEAARELARASLLAALDQELVAHRTRLLALLGRPASDSADAPGVPGAEVALRGRVGEGRAAVVGGLLSGAAAGLKADVLSGGLTMGAGALAGGLLGALGAAGAARGLNVLRGTDRSHVAWDEVAMQAIATALLQRWAALLTGFPQEDATATRLVKAVEDRRAELARAWALRGVSDEVRQKTAAALRAPLTAALMQALGPPSAQPSHGRR